MIKEFPEELQEKVREIRSVIDSPETMKSMTNEELEGIAQDIFSLHNSIAVDYCPPDNPESIRV